MTDKRQLTELLAAVQRESSSRRNVIKRAAALGLGTLALPSLTNQASTAQESVTLTVLTHWGEQEVKSVLQPFFEEYEQLNPNVQIEHQTVAFDELLNRITTGRLGGQAPDVYHFYNLWLPDFVSSDLLAAPPDDVTADITSGSTEGTVNGVTYNDQVWGYPTEVNTYQLIYNKQLLEEAGVTKAPETWAELRDAAEKATKRNAGGNLTQAGFLLIHGWDSGVVHPWTSLLWSNDGQYVADDHSEVMFNAEPGIETLQLELEMIENGSVDLGLAQADFVAGKAAMTIMANWWGAALRAGMPGGIDNVGVAPIPHNEGDQSVALQYNWLWGVDRNSQQADEAWRFLQWLNSARNGEGSSPMGDFLTTGLNAIPARITDQEGHADILGDPFVQPFVDALENARTEPIIPGAQEIKTALQKQIEAAWFGEKSAQEALDAAAEEANRILDEKVRT